MPSEHLLIFTSTILELLVLLFVGYEVVIGEIRHRRPMTEMTAQSQSTRRGISMRLGLFIVLISGAIWATVVTVTIGLIPSRPHPLSKIKNSLNYPIL
jgi:hypothetical protein